MKKMRRIWKWTIGTAAVLAALLVVAEFCLGAIAKKSVEELAPMFLDAPVKVGTVQVMPFLGIVRVGGLVVGPPDGYKANVFELSDFKLDMSIRSVFTDTIRIRDITIRHPVVTYEVSGIESNIGQLMRNINAATGADGKKKSNEKVAKKSGKKVVIDHFLFRDGRVRIASSFTGGKGLVVPLPLIELTDIGKETHGIGTVEAVGKMTGAIVAGVVIALKDAAVGIVGFSADLVEGVGKSIGHAAVATGKAVVTLGGLIGGDDDRTNGTSKAESAPAVPAGK